MYIGIIIGGPLPPTNLQITLSNIESTSFKPNETAIEVYQQFSFLRFEFHVPLCFACVRNFTTLKPEQNYNHSADGNSKCILSNEKNVLIVIHVSLMCIP